MSRLRRLVLSDRYFFVTCNVQRKRKELEDRDFRILARGAGAEAVSVSAVSEAEWGLNGAVQKPQHYGGKRPWPGLRF
jgi:hypothetical protein